MAEVIGVAASIVGIIAAAGKVAEILNKVIPILTHLQPNAIALSSETTSIKIILTALQQLVADPNVIPRKRKDLVQLDQLITILTDGVLLFSQLEALVSALGGPTDVIKSRMRWGLKEKELGVLYTRVLSFEGSVSVMLNILQCASDSEASRSQDDLMACMVQMLNNNRDLAQRIENLETNLPSIRYTQSSRSSVTSQQTVRPITLSFIDDESDEALLGLVGQFSFEEDLESSRPYRQARRDSVDFSFRSSIARSHAWTALSEISLSDISLIAVIALPVDIKEITNAHHYMLDSQNWPLQNLSQGVQLPVSASSSEGPPPTRHYNGSISQSLGKVRAELRAATPVHRIMLLGVSGVGKTGIATQFTLNHFVQAYDPTIDDSYRKECIIDKKLCFVEVFDTAGLDEYRALRDGWIRESHAFMLVYSIASRSSFDHLIKLRNEVLRVKQKDVPMMLVGNRCVSRAQRRLVSVREGTTLAEQFGSLFEEMDCESGFNVDNAFFNLVRGIRRETT